MPLARSQLGSLLCNAKYPVQPVLSARPLAGVSIISRCHSTNVEKEEDVVANDWLIDCGAGGEKEKTEAASVQCERVGCDQVAIFGKRGGIAKRCEKHRLKGMQNLHDRSVPRLPRVGLFHMTPGTFQFIMNNIKR